MSTPNLANVSQTAMHVAALLSGDHLGRSTPLFELDAITLEAASDRLFGAAIYAEPYSDDSTYLHYLSECLRDVHQAKQAFRFVEYRSAYKELMETAEHVFCSAQEVRREHAMSPGEVMPL